MRPGAAGTAREPAGPTDPAPGAPWIYVAGAGRSGSTLLGALLGQAAGAFDCGELVQLWSRLGARRLCQCGVEVTKCEVWAAVAAEVRRTLGPRSVEDAAARIDDLRSPHPYLHPPRPTAADVELRVATERAVEQVTGARAFVDTSKSPFGLSTALARQRCLSVVHLVRDPRAVAYSNLHPRADPARSGALQRRRPLWRTSLLWDRQNYLTERLISDAHRQRPRVPSVRLTYEELVTEPDRALDQVLAVLGLPVPRAGATAEATAAATRGHAVAGNPVLFDRTPVESDRRWRGGMARREMALVAALTVPLLRRYGYPLRAPRTRDRR
jgi:hypothetical protein